jgi:hypothetical protein
MKRSFTDEHGVRWDVEDLEAVRGPHDPEITPAQVRFSATDGRAATTAVPEGALKRAGDDALRLWLLEALAGR